MGRQMVSNLVEVKIAAALQTFNLNVEFSVEARLTVLFGPSGCGKSTVLNCLAGLRKPDSGSIVVCDKTFFDVAQGINLPPQSRQIGYVFQNPSLFPHLTVFENIAFGIDKWDTKRRNDRVNELLELLNLSGLGNRRVSQISGGQIQRVALARALAPEPKLVLLDEPFSALDSELRNQLAEELLSMQKQLALPMVLVTHSRAEALQMADTVVLLDRGQVTAIGSPQSLLGNPHSARISSNSQFSW
jgi:molybdate transport system ATP-binding protein